TATNVPDTGTESGTHTDTQSSNNVYHSITEVSAAATYDEDFAASETANESASVTVDHEDTWVLDGTTEDIVEDQITGGTSTTTLIPTEGFESATWPAGWTEAAGTSWNPETNFPYTDLYSADFDGATGGGVSGTLQSPAMDTSTATSITVDFWWREDDADTANYELYYYDDTGTWDQIEDLAVLQATEDTWYQYQETITDSQYLHSAFQIQWRAVLANGEAAWLDDVNVTMEVITSPYYSLEHKWTFTTTPSSANQYEFRLHAGWDIGGAPNDEYMFYYATENSGDVGTAAWTYMFSVETQALSSYTFDLDADGYTGGAFYVGAIDNTSANSQADTLEVDYMCVNTTVTPVATRLEHKWTISVASTGTDTNFNLEAYRTDQDGENMEFYYSTTGAGVVSTWTKMLDVTATSDPGTYQTFSDATLDAFTGTLYIGVIDDSTADSNTDTIYVDHMYVSVGGATLETYFGWSVADAGNLNGGTNGDVIIGAPADSSSTGKAFVYLDGDFETSTSRTDTSQADFTASGSSLATTNPSNNIFATTTGELNLTSNIIIEDDFEDDAGPDPDDPPWGVPTQATNTDVAISTTVAYGGSQSLMLDDDSATADAGCAIIRDDFTTTTVGAFEFWARCADQGTSEEEFAIILRSGNTDAIEVGFNDGAFAHQTENLVSSLRPYVANQWYHFLVAFDCDTDLFDYYIDGELQGAGLGFTTPVTTVDNIEITTEPWSFADPALNDGQALGYVDDIKLYTLNSPGEYTSATTTTSYYITAVKAYWNMTAPTGTTSWINISRDGGTTWNQSAIYNGVWYTFPTEVVGKELQYKIEMATTHIGSTSILHNVSLYYQYCNAPDVTYIGEVNGDRFGYSVAGLGDYNGDTFGDVIVGAPFNENSSIAGSGAAYIFNGSNSIASSTYAWHADYVNYSYDENSYFGWSVDMAGDLDGDSEQDIIVGAPGFDSTNSDAGKAWIMCIVIPVPEFTAGLIAIIIPFGMSVLVIRRKRRGKKHATTG
ncbi:MAG: FG-GAP repeat protein, partial [Thermoplasmata archaeon]|nr:FG-GAP repeat protein [Thermoplasmata archaeon]